MQTIQNTIIGTLETVKDKLEQSNEAVQKRDKVFAKEQEKPEEEEEEHEASENYEKFKKVSFELLDIGIFYGQQGVQQVKSLPLYQKVDAAVNLEDKFSLVL